MRARIISGFLEGIPAEFVCGDCGERFDGRVDPEDGAPLSDTACPRCGEEAQPTGEPTEDWFEEE